MAETIAGTIIIGAIAYVIIRKYTGKNRIF